MGRYEMELARDALHEARGALERAQKYLAKGQTDYNHWWFTSLQVVIRKLAKLSEAIFWATFGAGK